MKKVLTIVGARPQFVKAAVVSRAFKDHSDFDEVLVHTGQHYDEKLSDLIFEQLNVPTPKYHLGVGSLGHGAQTGRMLESLEKVILEERPDWVLVYGDTNSTLAGALAAVKLHIPVAHVEAGLRSFNRKMPEEINRVVTDHVSTLLFAPTSAAVANLKSEGIFGKKVIDVGDVMFDAVLAFGASAESVSSPLSSLGLEKGRYVLATIHRAESTDQPGMLEKILRAFGEVNKKIPVVIPLHPRTRAVIERDPRLMGLLETLKVLGPIGYLEMLQLEKQAAVIVTDSGGVQKEAFFQSVPCVTLRTETEWVELITAGWNRLAPLDSPESMAAAVLSSVGTRGRELTDYGNGSASEKIVSALGAASES